MKKIIILLFQLFFMTQVIAQCNESVGEHISDKYTKWANYLSIVSKPITSITDTNNFSDLGFLQKEIADKRIIFLGEEEHGVLEFNLINNRLIRYFHEKLGFNVIIFETGFNEIAAINLSRNSFTSQEILDRTVHPAWNNKINWNLISWYKKDNSLQIAGIDLLSSKSSYSATCFSKYLSRYDPNLGRDFYERDSMFKVLLYKFNRTEKSFHYSKRERTEYCDLNEKNNPAEIKEIQALGESLMGDFDHILLKIQSLKKELSVDNDTLTLIYRAVQNRVDNIGWIVKSPTFSFNYRDSVMAGNLLWLLDFYKNEKVMVWAHNTHIARNNKNYNTMGSVIPDSIKEKSFVIGNFSSGENSSNKNIYPFIIYYPLIFKQIKKDFYYISFHDEKEKSDNAWMFRKNNNVDYDFKSFYSGFDGAFIIKNTTTIKK